jgi:hypothetical protein
MTNPAATKCFEPKEHPGELFEAWLRHLKASSDPDADIKSMRLLDPRFEPHIVGFVGRPCRYAIIDLSRDGILIERFRTRKDALSFLHRLGMRDGSPAGAKAVAERMLVLESLRATFMQSVTKHFSQAGKHIQEVKEDDGAKDPPKG